MEWTWPMTWIPVGLHEAPQGSASAGTVCLCVYIAVRFVCNFVLVKIYLISITKCLYNELFFKSQRIRYIRSAL